MSIALTLHDLLAYALPGFLLELAVIAALPPHWRAQVNMPSLLVLAAVGYPVGLTLCSWVGRAARLVGEKYLPGYGNPRRFVAEHWEDPKVFLYDRHLANGRVAVRDALVEYFKLSDGGALYRACRALLTNQLVSSHLESQRWLGLEGLCHHLVIVAFAVGALIACRTLEWVDGPLAYVIGLGAGLIVALLASYLLIWRGGMLAWRGCEVAYAACYEWALHHGDR